MRSLDTAEPEVVPRARTARPATGLDPQRLRRRPWWIAGGYVVVAAAWILFSDQALSLLISDPAFLVRIGTLKGLAFVVITGALLLILVRRSFHDLRTAATAIDGREAEVDRLRALYDALQAINRSLVRRPDREQLFGEVCRTLVETGGFRMAWVGRHDTASRELVPESVCGDTLGYLDEVTVRTDDGLEGLGPSGTAIREGTPQITNDLVHATQMAPRRETLERHDFRAAATFPLWLRGEVWGLLNVYSSDADYFQTDEIALLVEAADNLSYAMDSLVRDQEQQAAEAAARDERLFSENMIDALPGILYFYDTDGRFLRWNRNFEAVAGCTTDEVAAMHPLEFFAPGERPRVEAAIRLAFTAGEASVEAEFVSADGSATPYLLTGRRVEIDERACLIGVGIDISERVQAEAALVELNATLEQKVADRTAELEVALDRAEAADRIKSSFLATMSHELRTPLNSIIGFTGIVLQELAGPLNAEQTRQLGMVRTSARHLLALINDVLDISKIEAGQLEVRTEAVDLAASIRKVTAAIAPQLQHRELELAMHVPDDLGPLLGDQRRVEQILINLLSNAVKFTDTGSITVTVEPIDGRADPHTDASTDDPGAAGTDRRPWVRIEVGDTGIGIEPEDLEALFQPFRQIDSGITRQHDGTGLGLAICRRLATLMGGTVTATSEPGVGSVFAVVLPRQEPSEP